MLFEVFARWVCSLRVVRWSWCVVCCLFVDGVGVLCVVWCVLSIVWCICVGCCVLLIVWCVGLCEVCCALFDVCCLVCV